MGESSIERLKEYLGQLPAASQALLMREFERALEREPRTVPEPGGRLGQAGGIGALDAAPAAFGLREVLCHFKVRNGCFQSLDTDQPTGRR